MSILGRERIMAAFVVVVAITMVFVAIGSVIAFVTLWVVILGPLNIHNPSADASVKVLRIMLEQGLILVLIFHLFLALCFIKRQTFPKQVGMAIQYTSAILGFTSII